MTQVPFSALFRNAPMTIGIVLAAIVVSIHGWTGGETEVLMLTTTADALQPWRYFTAALPHDNLFHLTFNVVCLCFIGLALEPVLGSGRLLLMAAVLAAGSTTAEFAVADGIVGLSGVVYGLFAMLWVMSRRDPRFAGAVGTGIVWLFVGWFAFIVAMNALGMWNIGIAAHVAGAILGGAFGLTVVQSEAGGWLRGGALLGAVVLLIAGAVVARPYINFSPARAQEIAQEGDRAVDTGDYESAAELFARAVQLDASAARHHYRLGAALSSMYRYAEAVESLQRAVELAPDNRAYLSELNRTLAWKRAADAEEAFVLGDYERSAAVYQEALAHDAAIPELWYSLGSALAHLDRFDESAQAYRRALNLDPTNADLVQAAQWAEAWAVALRAGEALAAENYEQSASLYRHALRSGEEVYEWWLNLGYALSAVGDFRAARNAYMQAIRLDPDREEAPDAVEWLDGFEEPQQREHDE